MRPHHFFTIIATLIWFTLPSTQLLADLKLPSFFSNQMVLQRGKPVSIWGWADANTQVDIAFNGNTVSTKSTDEGNWKITLPAMKASRKGMNMVIENTRQLRGEVDDSCPVGTDGRRRHTYDYAEGGCRQVKDAELSANLGWASPGTGSAMVMARDHI